MEVLRSATAARRCVDRAMGPLVPREFDARSIERVARRGDQEMRACEEAIGRFAADTFLAESVLNADTYDAAFRLYSFINGQSVKYRLILELLEEGVGKSAYDEQVITELLDELGADVEVRRAGKRTDVNFRNQEVNPYPELFNRNRDLVKLLSGYLRFLTTDNELFIEKYCPRGNCRQE